MESTTTVEATTIDDSNVQEPPVISLEELKLEELDISSSSSSSSAAVASSIPNKDVVEPPVDGDNVISGVGNYLDTLKRTHTLEQLTLQIAKDRENEFLRRQQLASKKLPAVSYTTNTAQEVETVNVAEEKSREFVLANPTRMKPIVSAVNEYGCKKYIGSWIRPTLASQSDIHDHRRLSHFLAHHILPAPVSDAEKMVNSDSHIAVIQSGTRVLETQQGSRLEKAILLTSFLNGAGYSAYVVCGWAHRHALVPKIVTLEKSPPAAFEIETYRSSAQVIANKYSLAIPAALVSKFQQQRDKIQAFDTSVPPKMLKPADVIVTSNPVELDFWVMIMPGQREILEPCFVHTDTGVISSAYTSNDSLYVGIEFLFNHLNYYINLQNCSVKGLEQMEYQLDRENNWNALWPDTNGHHVITWIPHPFEISALNFDLKTPAGYSFLETNKTLEELYTHRQRIDCKTSRVINKCATIDGKESLVYETFKDRRDKLQQRKTYFVGFDFIANFVFERGRADACRLASYKNGILETTSFYEDARADNLVQRSIEETEMAEIYSGRDDGLISHHVTFSEPGFLCEKIVSIVEGFASSPHSKDISGTKKFLMQKETIEYEYEKDASRLFPVKMVFAKARPDDEHSVHSTSATGGFKSCLMFDSYPEYKEPVEMLERQRKLYQTKTFAMLDRDESICLQHVRNSVRELAAFNQARIVEEESTDKFEVHVADWSDESTATAIARQQDESNDVGGQNSDSHRKSIKSELDQGTDYLTPFLTDLNIQEKISGHEAVKVRDQCLKFLKSRILLKAQLIQKRNIEETKLHQQFAVSMSENDSSLIADSLFKLQILEKRLSKLKDSAPEKYLNLDKKLRNDPRFE